MSDLAIQKQIEAELGQIESENRVRVLYACESGSRAWGFASSDSDYDVRFIYVQSFNWYLSIEDRRDVIEKPCANDLDVSGWDLRKALRLLRKSNPPLLEWLTSPIAYRVNEKFLSEFRAMARTFYSPSRCLLHYLHMATGNWRDYLCGREEVSLKKYLYVLRPLLACRWIEQELGLVPIVFAELLKRVVDVPDVAAATEGLLDRKRAGEELGVGPHDKVLDSFIESELTRLESLVIHEEPDVDVKELNAFFQRIVCPRQ